MRIVITGSDGFIARNLRLRLTEIGGHELELVNRSSSATQRAHAIGRCDFIMHLAGVNRPQHEAEFGEGNVELTREICALAAASGRSPGIAYASSTQAGLDNPYGRSKRAAEELVRDYGSRCAARAFSLRLPNVFGKWSRPNYNSVVATFCTQVARGLPLSINDPASPLRLVYVDDVVATLIGLLDRPAEAGTDVAVAPVYETTVGELARTLQAFRESRTTLVSPPVGTGFVRALYSTYISFLEPSSFGYQVPCYGDPRGVFVEMLKTHDSGQFSYFTAGPGVTRGEHYHHTKTEKFLIVSGTARFQFRHLQTGEVHELVVRGGEGRIVETVPGWVHNITNVGDDQLVVMLWANEIFDRARPDTVAAKVIV